MFILKQTVFLAEHRDLSPQVVVVDYFISQALSGVIRLQRQVLNLDW